MAIPLTVNGDVFSFPEEGDVGYATQVTSWAEALTNGCVQLGGSYALLSDITVTDFGFVSPYFSSGTANPAAASVLRLAKTDSVAWRNNANGADLELGITTDDDLTFEGERITGQPYLEVNKTTAQAFSTGVGAAILYNNTVTDTDSGYNAATGLYTVPAGKGGRYLVSACLRLTSLTANTGAMALSIRKNGTDVQEGNATIAGNGTDMQFSCAGIINASAGDTLGAAFIQTNAASRSNTTVATANRMTIQRLV